MASILQSFRVRPEWIAVVREHFFRETGETYSDEAIIGAIHSWLNQRLESMFDDVADVITTPHLPESQRFREILESKPTAPEIGAYAAAAEMVVAGTVFNGFRSFSPAKLGAMIEHIVRSGHNIYKTNLNKLLFYSDLTFYYLHRRGISGATYLNLPYGPVPDTIEQVLEHITSTGRIIKDDLPALGRNAQILKPGDGGELNEAILSEAELETIDWVVNKYGQLSPTEISELSHREKAYASTRPNEPIAYEYAKFLQTLPPK